VGVKAKVGGLGKEPTTTGEVTAEVCAGVEPGVAALVGTVMAEEGRAVGDFS